MIDLKMTWTPTQAEFDLFAEVSGDDNAIHVDPAFCATTHFGRTVSHGMLIYTKLWGMLQRLNPDMVQQQQSLMFPNPAFAEEALHLEIKETETGHVTMRATRVADGHECLIGEARVQC